MGRITLFFIAIISTFLMGCSGQNISQLESLEESYFYIATELENKNELSKDSLKGLLTKYDNSKTCNSEGQIYYYFKDKNGLLTITTNSKEKITNVRYYNEVDKSDFTFNYSVKSEKLNVLVKTEDTSVNNEIFSLLDFKDSKFLSSYNQFLKNVSDDNTLDVDSIASTLKLDPVSKSSSNPTKPFNTSYHDFEKDNEKIKLTYLEDEKKIGQIKYVNYSSDNEITLERDILIPEYSSKENIEIYTIALVDSLSTQSDILDVLK